MSKAQKLQDKIDNKLLENRRIFLWGQVDDDSAKHVIDRLMFLELEDPGKEIQLIINSPGGYVTAGFSIYDTMEGISSPVSTIATGLAASMGSILLSAGEKGKRFALPHARVMIHQPSGGARGMASDIEISYKEIMHYKKMLTELYVKHNTKGKTYKDFEKDMDRDTFMSAQEALDYGLIDRIVEKM